MNKKSGQPVSDVSVADPGSSGNQTFNRRDFFRAALTSGVVATSGLTGLSAAHAGLQFPEDRRLFGGGGSAGG